MRKVEAVEL